ncbi:DNA-3-methyladenine glycosylase II [Actinopolyspora mzabensis]|uniref:DNA-3-methyladenine glycosylase II n=1 Tax=Actinopolyspora mzabensis TaxID=995066 RepID=A0A1G8VTI8_ACTMZ|nr:AlkA N-terminal domain-containing protein [Actinopolyspora mzabensis]SDJ69173.1 DNA-3-methyladenine glycosylase II [Actinopolyspora mzabensis]
MLVTPQQAYRAVTSRDIRFDGCFVTGVRSTGIYCRPSCPARTPKSGNVEFFATAAAAQQAGYRACRRCLPDAVPGSPEWNLRADLAGRAMRLVTDGLVEREGVPGLAARLGYSTRQLTRVLTEELGAGPLALARAHRAHTARLLIATTELNFTDIAYAAGFASLRQFNETVREVFATNPTGLRARTTRPRSPEGLPAGTLRLRLPMRLPFDAPGTLGFHSDHAVDGVEWTSGSGYGRTLRLPHGHGVAELTPRTHHLAVTLRLTELRDLGSAVARLRRLFDLDCDPVAVDEVLGSDPALAGTVARTPGVRLPGSADGTETAVRALLGKAGPEEAGPTGDGRAELSKLIAELGERVPALDGTSEAVLFPTAEALADGAARALPGSGDSASAIRGLATALTSGALRIDEGREGAELREELRGAGLGERAAEHVSMRVLGEPDSFPLPDGALRRGAGLLGLPDDAALLDRARQWSPWRSYAAVHLWRAARSAPNTTNHEHHPESTTKEPT